MFSKRSSVGTGTYPQGLGYTVIAILILEGLGGMRGMQILFVLGFVEPLGHERFLM